MLRRSARLRNKALKVEDELFEDNDPDEKIEVAAWNGTKHPLETPVILQHLFKLCPASTLASCRQVCKLWYHESLVSWRTEVPLQVAAIGTDIFLGRNETPFHEFLEFVNEPGSQGSSKPFRNVRLEVLMDNRGRFYPVNDIFWKAMGNNLATLELVNYKFLDVHEFRKIVYKSCPNLKNLIIRCPLMLNRNRKDQINWPKYKKPAYGEQKNLKFLHLVLQTSTGGQLPVSWIELFSHFPSLTFFRFAYSRRFNFSTPPPLSEELVDAIRIIRKHDKNMLPFKSFALWPTLKFTCDPDSTNDFAVIRELHLPLSHLDIVLTPDIDESRLMDTLKGLRKSVKWINFFNPIQDQRLDLAQIPKLLIRNFPFGNQLDNLLTLNMRHDFFESFAFLKYTPNLSALTVYDSENNYYNKPTTTTISNTSAEELANVKMRCLQTFYLDYKVSEDDLQSLLNWMPNITELSMVLNDKQFGMVCQNWKNLKKLVVFGQELTNEGVAGIGEAEGTNEADLCPNISKLTSLETFQYDTNKLTTESVLHAFLRLRRLRILQRFALLRLHRDNYYRGITQDTVADSWVRENVRRRVREELRGRKKN